MEAEPSRKTGLMLVRPSCVDAETPIHTGDVSGWVFITSALTTTCKDTKQGGALRLGKVELARPRVEGAGTGISWAWRLGGLLAARLVLTGTHPVLCEVCEARKVTTGSFARVPGS